MNKTKIAHLQLLPLLSGVQNIMLSLLESLDQDKYEIYVISKPGGPLVKKVKELGFNYIPAHFLERRISLKDIPAFIELIMIFKEYKFDLVHTHSSKTGFLGRIAGKIAKVPKVIHTVHGFSFNPTQPFFVRKFYFLLEKFAAYFADKMIVINDEETKIAIEKLRIKEDKIKKIYNGVKLNNVRRRFDNRRKLNIGWVARFEKVKNVILTIEVAVEVCKKSEDIEFYLIGNGTLFEKARKIVKDNRLDDRIHLLGWQNNIPKWLLKFDIFMLLSKFEGLSLSILEAMASRLPIIGSNVKGVKELVNDKNGYLVDTYEKNKIVELIVSLLDKKQELQKKGEESYEIVKKRYNFDKFFKLHLDVYNE